MDQVKILNVRSNNELLDNDELEIDNKANNYGVHSLLHGNIKPSVEYN